MKKLIITIFVLASVLLMSNFAPIRSTLSQPTATYKVTSAGIMAPPPLFPTNATFETKAEIIGNYSVGTIGGTSGADYVGQSFKALSDYIINCALWLQNYTGTTPDLRLMLCNATESGWPNVAQSMFNSSRITGATIDARPGRFFFNLTEPIRVQQNRTYWLVIDGYKYGNATVGGAATMTQWYTGTYADGYTVSSIDVGASWMTFATTDLDFVVNFSNRPTKAEVFGTSTISPVGGFDGSDYYAQSFKAMDSYIVDAGVWIEADSGITPNMRVQVWGNNVTDGSHPNKNNVITSSRVIAGSEINSTSGRYFVHPNVSIPVIAGETYWLVIDGYYDHTTNGTARSRYGYGKNPYPDGNFVYSNNAGNSWAIWSTSDLDFIVTFSASRSAIKMMKGNNLWTGIGGTGVWNYAGQSFKALNKYILNAGVWLQNNTNTCPTVNLLICLPSRTNASQPDVSNPIAASIPITDQQIKDNPGMQYLNPTKPVEVVPGLTYFFIINGTDTTAGNLRTYDRGDDPYKDGYELASSNMGATWTAWGFQYDLGVDMTFSDVPYEAQCGSTDSVVACGWQALTPYYAQGFVALNDYISDAGLWLNPASGTTPDFRLLLVGNNATSYNHPDMTNILAMSMRIAGTDISANPGMYYIKPPTPIPVERLQRYWLVIDGSYDQVTVGTAGSRSVDYDAYPDGEFLWAYKNLNQGWHPDTVNDRYDLHFDVVFTHVNQPPTQPDVTISPLKPLDSDDLTVQFPIPSADFEDEPVLYYVEWYKNGIPQPAWANNIVVLESATLPTEDWTATVTPYDGHINGTSASYTVHVQADILPIDHVVIADSQTFHVITTSNTTTTDFAFSHTAQYQPANITFTSTGPAGAVGFCNITIPKNLMTGPWVIIVNGILVDPPKTDNGTHVIIQLEYLTSSVPIIIQGSYAVPEFTPTMLLITLALTTLAVAVVSRKINKKKQ